MEILSYFEDWIYLFVLAAIMVISGIAKEHKIFNDVYGYLKYKFKSNRVVISILSFISGILPIQGRAIVSAGILDTVTSNRNVANREYINSDARKKLGVVDYITTHHFYTWSPLEKTVILPMAAFSLSYTAWLGMVWPLIAVSALFIGCYIWFGVKENEVEIKEKSNFKLSNFFINVAPFLIAIAGYIYLGGEGPSAVFTVFGLLTAYYIILTKTFSLKKLNSYINWKTMAIIAFVFVAAAYTQAHRDWIERAVNSVGVNMHTPWGITLISSLAFIASFSMGSSSKFAALTLLLSSVFGVEYFLWFFALDYAAYLVSPFHDCVWIGKRYFGTSLKTYYTALISWALLLILTAGAFTFIF